MTTIALPVKAKEHPHIRALNVLRDLSTVADLIELCFSNTMDNDGQRYVNDMRRAGRDEGFLRWANHIAETTSLPLMGFVWEEDGRIVGNASLIQFRDKGKRIHLIANVATHPDYRRRGIARALTERTLQSARDKKTDAVWLHVREDNPGAVRLYGDLGFTEVARRTSWISNSDSPRAQADSAIQIIPRSPRFWNQQAEWLRRRYPDSIAWYHSWNFNTLRPGFWAWLANLFMDFDLEQWAAVRGDDLLGALTWLPNGGRSSSLFAAVGDSAPALTQLLLHARRAARNSTLMLDFPGGEMTEAVAAAGFSPRRTLIWMRA
ncbi:MAG: GNAT family N-acetyltransferase [Anaerolineales bacterium]|nr:GNAT family N-acetyltransferase [Anaerolineales bacterium]